MAFCPFDLHWELDQSCSLQQFNDVVQAENGQSNDQKRRGNFWMPLDHANGSEDEFVLICLCRDGPDFCGHGFKFL